MPRPSLALIGRGPWGQNILRTLREMGMEPLVTGRNWRSDITSWGYADGIIVAAHPSINKDCVAFADQLGIPIMIEKPAALCLADVEEMAKAKVPIMVDYTWLWDPRPDDEVAADILSKLWGPCHEWGPLYDWGPHLLSLTMCGRTEDRSCSALGQALRCFLEVVGGHKCNAFPDFDVTLRIHRILDQVERHEAA